MCVVTRKTYVHSDNRREVVESHRLCHNAIGERLCGHVEFRSEESVRVKERKPSSSSRPSSADIITTSGGGREQHWKRFKRPSTSKRNSSGRDSRASASSPVDSAASSASPLQPVYQEFRPPSTQEPPLMSGALPSARHSGTLSPTTPTRPPNPFMSEAPGGSAVYDRPPSLDMSRAENNERPPLSRRASISSTAAEVDDPEPIRRRPSTRKHATFDPTPSGSKHRSTDKGKSRARTDPLRDDMERERQKLQKEQDDRDARIAREQLAATDRRQSDRRSRGNILREQEQAQIERDILAAAEVRRRSNLSREAEAEARRRADDLRKREEKREEALRERHRREAAATLEAERQTQRDEAYARLVEAERSAIDKERVAADARKRESAERYQEMRSSPLSIGNYTYAPSSPTSARQYTTVTTRPPNAIHQYPSARRNSTILERGERVIAREQERAMGASQRLAEAMGGLSMADEEELDADELERAARRARREARERRRQQGYH
ncbi:hypothetical protein M409DRAFT_17829 [Zasmidium cellare ATCC 36951]|uniref:Uncharacterized protein n=1 Tax=Zasmidium cellare ATCC 36951 TaxID=1080233 RepID=A0A6A6D0I3_ZASCE|nr:uncharacterized protein M409DRAFT_17829 [Zasmidium cellare ATCC 36951]KAF2171589.1 hypothetical protein M409DRAFT_17829 [Zasmidium cellare ATCC 36951]